MSLYLSSFNRIRTQVCVCHPRSFLFLLITSHHPNDQMGRLGRFQSDRRSAVTEFYFHISPSAPLISGPPHLQIRGDRWAEQIEREEPRPRSMEEDRRRWGRRGSVFKHPASPFADIWRVKLLTLPTNTLEVARLGAIRSNTHRSTCVCAVVVCVMFRSGCWCCCLRCCQSQLTSPNPTTASLSCTTAPQTPQPHPTTHCMVWPQ